MNKLILYGNAISQPSRAIQWFLLIHNIPFDFKIIRVEKGDQFTPQFQKINPFKKIPVLQDGENYYFESQAILIYLFHKYILQNKQNNNYWYPNPHVDLENHTAVNMYLAYHNATFRESVAPYVFKSVIGPISFGLKNSYTEKEIEQNKKLLLKALQLLNDYWLKSDNDSDNDRFIANQKKPTIADLLCYSELMQLLILTPKHVKHIWESDLFKNYLNICSWMKRMSTLEKHDEVFRLLYVFKEKSSELIEKKQKEEGFKMSHL